MGWMLSKRELAVKLMMLNVMAAQAGRDCPVARMVLARLEASL